MGTCSYKCEIKDIPKIIDKSVWQYELLVLLRNAKKHKYIDK